MSEQAPKATQENSSETPNPINEQHTADMQDFKLLDIAKVAVDAKQKGIDSQVVAAKGAIKAHLNQLVQEGQITEAGAKNRADQLNRIIDGASVGNETPASNSEQASSEYSNLNEADKAELIARVADEVAKIRDRYDYDAQHEEFKAEFRRLHADLMRDGGLTTEEADELILAAEAVEDARYEDETGTEEEPVRNGAPEGVPSTEEIEENRGKLTLRQKAAKAWKVAMGGVGFAAISVMNLPTRAAGKGKKFNQREGESDEQFEARQRRYGVITTVGAVAIGAVYLGYRVKNGLEATSGGAVQSVIETPAPEGTGDQGGAGADYTDVPNPENAAHTPFDYNRETDPFDEAGKTGVHNYGDVLDANAADIKGVAGTNELQDSWANSANQLSVAGAEMGLDGFSTDNLDGVASNLESNPEFAGNSHAQLLEILNNPNTKISEGTLEPGTYGSYYQVDVNGDLINAYDDTVNEPGTTIKIEWQDKNGVWREVEFKKECGGQIIHRHPVAEAVAQPAFITSNQEGGQGGGSVETQPPAETYPPTTQPPETQPPTTQPPETQPPVTQPPETQPPVTQPPETEPPVTQPPETLAPKEWDGSEPHEEGAPLAEAGELAPPAQVETDPVVVEQLPGQSIEDQEQTGGMADGAEATTPQEQEQQQSTDPATGAVDGGTETSLFGASTTADTEPASTSTSGATSATTSGGASAPAN